MSSVDDNMNDLTHLYVGKKGRRQNERELRKRFCKIIKMYTNIKELRKNLSIQIQILIQILIQIIYSNVNA